MGKLYRLKVDTDLAEKLEEKYDFSEEEIDDFPMHYWKIIDNLVPFYDKYYELRCLHTEDLLLYAMMYRNVSIEHNDIFDKKYFVERENEIIGFTKRVFESKSSSVKVDVLELYYKYGLLFESLCYRLTGKKISIISKPTLVLNNSKHFEHLIEGHLDDVFSINYLTEAECDIILRKKDTLIYSYYNSGFIFEVFPTFSTQQAFVEGIVLPYYFYGTTKLELHCLHKFLKKNVLNCPTDIHEMLKQKAYEIQKLGNDIHVYTDFPWHNIDEEISNLEKEKKQLEDNLQVAQKYPYYDREMLEKQEKLEGRILVISNRIQLKREERISRIKNQRHQLIVSFTNYVFSNANIWCQLFNRQKELNKYCNDIYKLLYYRRLIYSPELCHKLLCLYSSNTTYLNAILSKKNTVWCWSNERWNIGLKSRKGKMKYERRKIMREYKTVVESMLNQEYEQERIQREKEIDIRKKEEEKRMERYRFNIRNRHWRDQNVSFREADHIYIVDGTPLDSVTTFVKNCFPEFNADFHAKRKAEAMGITKTEILDMWEKKRRESREQGTEMHKKIEAYYLGKEPSSDETFELFKIFANKITLKPYRTEWAVYDWEQKIAGTIDFVDYQNGEYIIYDWKRSDKLIAKNGLPIKNSLYGEKALPPIDNLDDSPYYHYALQLSLYKYILEKNYGIIISKLRLGIFHPSYNKPYVMEIPYLQREINYLFNLKSEIIF